MTTDITGNDEAILLVVGDTDRWQALGREFPIDADLQFTRLEDVESFLTSASRPVVILSPAISTSFDAFDVATLLTSIGYRGPYRVWCPEIPNLSIIRRELKAHAPLLDCDVFQIEHPIPVEQTCNRWLI